MTCHLLHACHLSLTGAGHLSPVKCCCTVTCQLRGPLPPAGASVTYNLLVPCHMSPVNYAGPLPPVTCVHCHLSPVSTATCHLSRSGALSPVTCHLSTYWLVPWTGPLSLVMCCFPCHLSPVTIVVACHLSPAGPLSPVTWHLYLCPVTCHMSISFFCRFVWQKALTEDRCKIPAGNLLPP